MSPRILVVDDEPSLVATLTYALERENFEVSVAEDGEAAVEVALSGAFDLVLLDLGLPKLTGTEACRRIRAKSGVPIIMLTAKDSGLDLVLGLEVGADDYVTKPFSAEELLGRIRALLRRRELDRAAHGDMVRTVGGVSIDVLHDRVTVDGALVSLTPSEFKILNLLASSPGAVFTRRQILEHLWGSVHIGDVHTTEVHISSLRRKIASREGPKRLLTVRGVGYTLIDA
jgi:Response regulators consisting of a CheY-like receiver domain and a winged-helix DNA-binding domain